MAYIFKGSLRAYLCDDCFDNLSNITVKLYRLQTSDEVTLRAVLAAKNTFHRVSDEDIAAKQQYLLAETVTDAEGNFTIELSDTNYNGAAFDIDFECGTPPSKLPFPPKKGPFQFHITTLQPQWRNMDNVMLFGWSYSLTARYWCYILSLYDIWTICGRLVDCATQRPIAKMLVSAFDSDLFVDDEMGSDITDALGHFRIQFLGDVFRPTIIPGLNIEFPSGPDVYFQVTVPGTSPTVYLLKEPSNAANTIAGRKNIGPCLCVDLCVSQQQQPPTTYEPLLFTHVGAYDITTNFDANGYTNDAEKNAFTRSIPLIGVIPDGNASNAMEYRFKIKNLTTLVEVIADASYIDATQIGSFNKITLSPFTYSSEPYYVNNAPATHNVPIAVDGWIKVPRENDLFGTGAFSAGTVLAVLDTTKLVNESFDIVNPTVYVAGNPFPAAKKSSVHTFQITFEAREVGLPLTVYSIILPKIVISNISYLQRKHPSWAGGDVTQIGVGLLELGETTLTGAGCNEIGTELHAVYSVVHPHLEKLTISFEGNAPLPPDFVISPVVTDELVGNQLFNTSMLVPCAYVVHLIAPLRLTQGWGRPSWAYVEDHIAFCKS